MADKHTPKLFTEADLIYAFDSGYMSGHHDTVESRFTDIHPRDFGTFHEEAIAEILDAENIRPSEVARELLEALEQLLIDMTLAQTNMRVAAKRDPNWEGCAEAIQPRVDAARAAIAKARGEHHG